jgi:hypothetical protein
LLIALIAVVFGDSWEFSLAALLRDGTVLRTTAEAIIVGLFASVAALTTGRALPPVAVGFGLISASAFLVHLSGGAIEFHFHFFVVLAFLALYQDRISYLLVLVYLVIYHVLVGAIWPHHVYGHPAALAAPLKWAAIHSFFFIAAAVGVVLHVRHGVDVDQERDARHHQAHEHRQRVDQDREVGAEVAREVVHLRLAREVARRESTLNDVAVDLRPQSPTY